MNTPQEPGLLRVAVLTPSMQLNNTTVVHVRDESLTLVESAFSGKEIKLAPGLYHVSAVLQDGREHRRITTVSAGELKEVQLASVTGIEEMGQIGGPTEIQQAGEIEEADDIALAPIELAGNVEESGFANTGIDLGAPPAAAPSRTLIRVANTMRVQASPPRVARAMNAKVVPVLSGAIAEDHQRGVWLVHGDGTPTSIPTATVDTTGPTWTISLPVYGKDACMLSVDGGMRCPVVVSVDPKRTMVFALQNMLAKGEFVALAPVAEQAIELLRSKYQDPTGAALGALILYRLGRLKSHVTWLERLASDFPWLPDGDILLAALGCRDHEDLEGALARALSAAQRRPLYTEAYSVLLDMLRRWPQPSMIGPHDTLVAALARRGAYVAWESLYFCHSNPR